MDINSPINITSNITNKCSGSCALDFNFQDSVCMVNKMGADALRMSYDSSTDVSKYFKTFKRAKYEVSHITIYNNSLHLYNGKRTEAELQIEFSGDAGNAMIISIPIEQKMSAGAETKLNGSIITSIIMAIDSSKTGIRTATSSDNAAVKFASGDKYNLNNLIPSQQPFYEYIGHAQYQSSGKTSYNYVVFPRDSSIYVPTSAIERLNKITTPSKSPVSGVPQNTATYNSAGANSGEDNNEVYIECAPAGSDGVQLYKEKSATGSDTTGSSSDASFTNIIESEWFIIGIQIILFGFVAIIIVFIGYKIFRSVSESNSETSSKTNSIR